VPTDQLTPRTRGLAWLSLCILLQTLAGVFAKEAALASQGSGWMAMVLNPWYVLELASLGGQAGCWIMVLRFLPLSVAYLGTSLVIILNLIVAWLVFGETIYAHHLVGVGLIAAGIVFVHREVGE
jgi:drug/metabolite transporter (DMT)-like permease